MSRHNRHYDRMPDGYNRGRYSGSGYSGDGPDGYQPLRLPRRISWIVVIAGLAVWSLLAWVAYALTDPVLGWVAASAGLIVESGKNIATVAGVGKEVGTVVDSLNTTGLLGQAVALLRIIMKPMIVITWGIGALALIVAPRLLREMGGQLARFRHH